MIVYHRTSAMFDIFDKTKLGKTSGWKTAKFGFYFSNKLEEFSYGRDYKACFLNIRKPYYIETEYFSDFDQDFKKFDTNNFSQNDGIIIKCNKIIPEYEKSDKHFVIFEPNQVKSIHNTSFSVDNNNIYL